MKHFKFFTDFFKPNVSTCKTIFTLGLPIGLQFGGELAVITVSTYLMGFFGITALSASQIVAQYTMLALMIVLGVAQGSSILVSEAFAVGNSGLIKQYFNAMLILIFGLFFVVFTVFGLLPKTLATFYLGHNIGLELMTLVRPFFIIASFMLLMDGLRSILSAGLRGLQDTKTPMRIGLICLWFISLPVAYLLAFVFNAGPVNLRIGFVSGYLVAAVLLWSTAQTAIKKLPNNQPDKYRQLIIPAGIRRA